MRRATPGCEERRQDAKSDARMRSTKLGCEARMCSAKPLGRHSVRWIPFRHKLTRTTTGILSRRSSGGDQAVAVIGRRQDMTPETCGPLRLCSVTSPTEGPRSPVHVVVGGKLQKNTIFVVRPFCAVRNRIKLT